MNSSTIKLDLSVFFSDERRKALLMLNPQWTTVTCLQKRVEELFGLDAVWFLNDDGCYIPPQESIEVIKFCAGLKAFVLSEDFPKKKTKINRSKILKLCEQKEIDKDISNDFELTEDTRKRKYCSLENGLSSSTPNNFKRVKNDVLLHPNPLDYKLSEITSTSEQLPLSSSHSKTKLKKSKSRNIKHRESPQDKVPKENKNEVEAAGHNEPKIYSEIATSQNKEELAVENESSNIEDCEEVEATGHNEPKIYSEIATSQNQEELAVENESSNIEDCEEINMEVCPTSLPSSTLISKSKKQKKKRKSSNMKNPFKDSIPNTNHIYYDEAGDITTTTTAATTCSPDKQNEEAIDKILLHCTLDDLDMKKPRMFPIKKQCTDAKASKKSCIEIQENILLNPCAPTPEGEIDDKEIEKSEHSVLVANTTDIDESKLSNKEAQSSTEEKNNSSTISASTINTAINQSTRSSEISQSTSPKQVIGADCSNLNSTETNGNNVSSSQTAQSEMNENSENSKPNESSIAVVDCVDLSNDDDDDPNFRAKSKVSYDQSNYDSDIEEVSEVIDLNDSEELSKFKVARNKLSKALSLCEKMEQLPLIGDIVVFKVANISAKGISSATDFITGEVQHINKRTKTIKLLILGGLSELYKVPNKYHSNLDDSCDEKYLQLKSSDMIEPKILRHK